MGVDELSEDFVDGFLGLALSWDCVSVSCVDVDEDQEVRGKRLRTFTALLKKVHLKGVVMIGEDWIVVTLGIMTV